MEQLPPLLSTCASAFGTFQWELEYVENPQGGNGSTDNLVSTLPAGVRHNKVLIRFLSDWDSALNEAYLLLHEISQTSTIPQVSLNAYTAMERGGYDSIRSYLNDANAQAKKLR